MPAKLDDAKDIMETVSAKSGKAKEDVEKLVEQKKAKFSGLLTDTGAAFMVAKDLGVELQLEKRLSDKMKVSQLEDGMNNADLIVEVKHIFAPKSFEKGGKKGKLCNLIVADDSGETRLTLWNKDVKKVEELGLKKGDKIFLRNCYVTAFQEKPQLNLGYNGSISVEEKGKASRTKLADLKNDLNDVDVAGRVIRLYEKRTFTGKKGEGQVLNFELGDESGRVRATAWNDLVPVIEKLSAGDLVRIEGAYTKEGRQGIELHLGWSARVLKDPETEAVIPKLEDLGGRKLEKVKISELKDGDTFKQLNGIIVSIARLPTLFKNCPFCRKKAEEIEGKFVCPNCGEIKPQDNIAFSFELDDGFGVIRSVCFGAAAEKILHRNVEQVKKEIEDLDLEFLDKLQNELVGRQLVVSGQARKNEMTEELEFTVREIIKINPLPEEQISEIVEEVEKSG